jgi:hypothetical protein
MEFATVEAPVEGPITGLQLGEGLTVDAKTKRLTSTPAITYARAREIRKDPTVNLVRRLCIAPALAADWTVESVSVRGITAPPEAEELIATSVLRHKATLLKAALFGMIDYGWCPVEVVWRLNEQGQLEPVKFKPLLVDNTYITVDDLGEYAGLFQTYKDLEGNDVEVDILGTAKALLFNQNVEGSNLYGESDYASVDAIVTQYDDVVDIAKAYDTKSAGASWVIKYPVGVTMYNGKQTDNGVIASQLLSLIRSNSGICIPKSISNAVGAIADGAPFNKLITANDWEIELKETTGASSAHLLERMKYLDVLKARALGMPERSVQEGTHGTKAEAEAHGDVALTFATDRSDSALEQLNAGPVDACLELNYGPQYRGTVKVISSPLGSDEKLFLRDLYKSIISNSSLSMLDFDNLDMAALRELIGVPSIAMDVNVDDPLQRVKSALENGGPENGLATGGNPSAGGTSAG